MSFGLRTLLTDNLADDSEYRFFINGDEYKLMSEWSFTEQIGNVTNSICSVLVENQPVPQAGDLVEYMNGQGDVLFLGICGIPKSPKFSTGFEPKIYQLTCTNANSILARRIPNISYQNMTITEIVQDLFDSYISQEGFTLGTLSNIPIPIFEVYNSKTLNLQQILNELANYVGGAWICTADRVFNFVIRNDFPLVATMNRNNCIVGSLQRSDSDTDLRTRQIVDGAFSVTDEQVEVVTKDSEDWQGFNTTFNIAQKPIIKKNGVQISDSLIGVRGIDDASTGVYFYWSYDNNTVSVSNRYEGSFVVNVGDTIEIDYVGIVPIRVETTNSEKQEEIARKTGTSGIIENIYTDTSITRRIDAENKANALLETYGEHKEIITATTDLQTAEKYGFNFSQFSLYSLWHFDMQDVDIVGDYVITERTIKPLVLNEQSSVIIQIKWTNRNFVQSYGETISNLYSDVSKLSVRAEEKIIKNENLYEHLYLSENIVFDSKMPQYVTTGMINGQIAIPLGSLYPYLWG